LILVPPKVFLRLLVPLKFFIHEISLTILSLKGGLVAQLVWAKGSGVGGPGLSPEKETKTNITINIVTFAIRKERKKEKKKHFQAWVCQRKQKTRIWTKPT